MIKSSSGRQCAGVLLRITEARSEHASIRYEGYLVAGVERWKEYVEAARAARQEARFCSSMLTATLTTADERPWPTGSTRKKYPDRTWWRGGRS